MSDLKHLVDTSIKMATASIIDAIRVYKEGNTETIYDRGYHDGLSQAIKLVQLFQAKLDEPRQKLDD
jgi:hypothetical protein